VRTRGLARDRSNKGLQASLQVGRRHPAFPAPWLYGFDVIALVTGFLAAPISFGFRFGQLDASTGASDPNDFTVGKSRARQSLPSRPPFPAPRLRRWPTPLVGQDGGSEIFDLPDVAKEIFLREALDRLLMIFPSSQFVADVVHCHARGINRAGA
jgi:hypothetical protein